jgi:hypothetical protein
MFAKLQKNANKLLFLLRECRKSSLPPGIGLYWHACTTKIRSILKYASPVWGGGGGGSLNISKQNAFRTKKSENPRTEERYPRHTKRKKGKGNMQPAEKNRGSPKQPMYPLSIASKKNQTYEPRRTRDSFPRQSSKTYRLVRLLFQGRVHYQIHDCILYLNSSSH